MISMVSNQNDSVPILMQTSLLVRPQWWNFEDMSQQGVDFSEKISKMKIFFLL